MQRVSEGLKHTRCPRYTVYNIPRTDRSLRNLTKSNPLHQDLPTN